MPCVPWVSLGRFSRTQTLNSAHNDSHEGEILVGAAFARAGVATTHFIGHGLSGLSDSELSMGLANGYIEHGEKPANISFHDVRSGWRGVKNALSEGRMAQGCEGILCSDRRWPRT
jgi:hypothetical protein